MMMWQSHCLDIVEAKLGPELKAKKEERMIKQQQNMKLQKEGTSVTSSNPQKGINQQQKRAPEAKEVKESGALEE